MKIQPATGSFARNLIYSTKPPKPDGLTAARYLAVAFEHYNEWHPHSALGYRSPREYLRRRTSNGLSDKWCMEI
nr:integrase core domain-containing protein [Klebsiella pneumoniae]